MPQPPEQRVYPYSEKTEEMQHLQRLDPAEFRRVVASTKRQLETISALEEKRSRWQRRASKDDAIDSIADLTRKLHRALKHALQDETLSAIIRPILEEPRLLGLMGRLALLDTRLRKRKSQAQLWTESRRRSLKALVDFVQQCSHSVNWELVAVLISLLSRDQIKITGTTLRKEYALIQRDMALRRGKSTQ